jgi:hypothetical protein
VSINILPATRPVKGRPPSGYVVQSPPAREMMTGSEAKGQKLQTLHRPDRMLLSPTASLPWDQRLMATPLLVIAGSAGLPHRGPSVGKDGTSPRPALSAVRQLQPNRKDNTRSPEAPRALSRHIRLFFHSTLASCKSMHAVTYPDCCPAVSARRLIGKILLLTIALRLVSQGSLEGFKS